MSNHLDGKPQNSQPSGSSSREVRIRAPFLSSKFCRENPLPKKNRSKKRHLAGGPSHVRAMRKWTLAPADPPRRPPGWPQQTAPAPWHSSCPPPGPRCLKRKLHGFFCFSGSVMRRMADSPEGTIERPAKQRAVIPQLWLIGARQCTYKRKSDDYENGFPANTRSIHPGDSSFPPSGNRLSVLMYNKQPKAMYEVFGKRAPEIIKAITLRRFDKIL